jgi:hypothetical protein
MFTISMTETIPDDYEWPSDTVSEKKSPERNRMLGDPLPASIGGEGEIRRSELLVTASRIVAENYDVFLQISDENQDDPVGGALEIDQYIKQKSNVVEQAGMIILRDVLLDTENTFDYNDVIDMVGEELVRHYAEITKGETNERS